MIIGISQFEKLFRLTANLDVDKADLKRLSEFVNAKLHDLLLMGEASAKANQRDIIQVFDLPITKGLQESMHAFKALDVELELSPILETLAQLPPLDLAYSEEVKERLPRIVGAITISLAKTFKVIDPDLKNPQSVHWERAIEIFNMLL
ncbi:MAG: DUF1931 family protein [Nitrospirae bacterium]|nr:MAG: DUF1931 family protein [Nitrospirota bacterium]